MKIHVLQHASFESPGLISTWIQERGHSVSFTHLYKNEMVPTIESFDFLIVMGGPMGVYDNQVYKWLDMEIAFIKQSIIQKKAVLGVCLGSQLIAAALGEKVYANFEKEIGWFPIHFSDKAMQHILFKQIPSPLTVFHWHGDTFDLPTEAMLIASSDGCKNQIFCLNERVVGLQCHLEVTNELLNSMIENCAAQLHFGKRFIQTKSEILAQYPHKQLQECLFKILDHLEASVS